MSNVITLCQRIVRSSQTPRADAKASHVEWAVGINVMRVDGKKTVFLRNEMRLIGGGPDGGIRKVKETCLYSLQITLKQLK